MLKLFAGNKPLFKNLIMSDPKIITTFHSVFQSLLEGGADSVLDMFNSKVDELNTFVDYLLCGKEIEVSISKILIDISSVRLTKLLLSQDRIK